MRVISSCFAALSLIACALPVPALAQDSRTVMQEPIRGVMESQAFRWRTADDAGLRRLLPGHSPLSPISFDEQLSLGWRAFHLPVYADPDSGLFARGQARDVTALKTAGLKVVAPPESPAPDALCFTLMTCVMQLDQALAISGITEPVYLILEPRRTPREKRLKRWTGGLTGGPAPTDAAISAELNAIAAYIASPNLVIVRVDASGTGRLMGPGLDTGISEVVARHSVGSLDWQIERPEARGALTILLNARQAFIPEEWSLTAADAARAGVDIVLFTPDVARGGD